MTKARTEQKLTAEQGKFVEAWMYHIQQLNSLAFQASVSPEELDALRAQLVGWVWDAPIMNAEEGES